MNWTTSRHGACCGLLLSLSVLACSSDEAVPVRLEGTLSLELRDELTLLMEPDGALPALRVRITPGASHGLLPVGQPLTAPGRIELFAEAGATLYTAKFDAPPQPGGPCGEQPISLAMALHRQGQNATVVGGLSAYCGQSSWSGVPVRILRLAGPVPVAPPTAGE